MFRTEAQRALVCQELLALWARPGLWDQERAQPSPALLELFQTVLAGSAPISRGEATWVRVVFDVWNGEGGANFSDVLYRLDPPKARAIGTFIAANASEDPQAIDR